MQKLNNCRKAHSIAWTESAGIFLFHHERRRTKNTQRSKRKLCVSFGRPRLHVCLLCLLLMGLSNCLALTTDSKKCHVNLHIFSAISWIFAIVLPFGHTFTLPHRITRDNHRYGSYDSALIMRETGDATGDAIDAYFARNNLQEQKATDDGPAQEEKQAQKASVESQNKQNFNVKMAMPSLPKLDMPKLDLASSKRFVKDKLNNNDEKKEPTVEVVSKKEQRFRNLKLEIPSMNVKDIPRPWTRSYDPSITDEKEVMVTDVDGVLDLSDENQGDMKRPLHLFGFLPQLEFDFNAQFDLFKKEDLSGIKTDKTQPFLLDSLTSSIGQITGHDKYEFGDLSKYVDSYAKGYMRNIQNDSQDLARRLDYTMEQKIKEISFTKAQMEQNVQTVTRTLIRKVATGEYDLSEITFLCKVLVALGADFAPVAGIMPVGALLEVFGLTLACGIGERFFYIIIKELDRRLQWNEEVKVINAATEQTEEDLVASESAMHQIQQMSVPLPSSSIQNQTVFEAYNPGDLTKQAIQDYTGSESYQVGSITEKTVKSGNDEVEDPIDVIRELEECLAMERELVQKLDAIRSRS